MSSLPPGPLSLTGGCSCSAIRYTISIPAVAQRDLFTHQQSASTSSGHQPQHHHSSSGPSAPSSPTATAAPRLPFVTIDHCQDCRRATGTVLQAWLICPRPWVSFRLQPRPADDSREASYADPFSPTEAFPRACPAVVSPDPDLLVGSYLACFQSSPDVRRCFCARCGTTLTYAYTGPAGAGAEMPPLVDVALGSLDGECLAGVRPERHCWWDDGVDWVKRMVWKGDTSLLRHPSGRINQLVND
jgi:hypothetical protein